MLKKLAITFLLFFSLASNALAYSEKTTHPALTQEIINFYGGLGQEEAGWVVAGSQLEDTPPRWVNHFYDPVHNTGWTGANAGNIPRSAVKLLSTIGVSLENPVSAVDWVHNYALQETYGPYGGNRTWERALEYYVEGNKKEAYMTIGHILHIAEDLTVPDHSRDDTHAQPLENMTGDEGSPYEQYTARYDTETIKPLGIAVGLKAEGKTPVIKPTIADYLMSLATYSNKYFFSKDTINSPLYANPKIIYENQDFAFGTDENGAQFPIASIIVANNGERAYSIKNIGSNFPILDSYFIRLSRQAVLSGAGIIALFEKQAKDAVINQEFNVSSQNTLRKISRNIGHAITLPNLSFVGLISGARNAISYAYGQVASATKNVVSYILGLFIKSPSQTVIADAGPQPKTPSAGNLITPKTITPQISKIAQLSPKISSIAPTATTTQAPTSTATSGAKTITRSTSSGQATSTSLTNPQQTIVLAGTTTPPPLPTPTTPLVFGGGVAPSVPSGGQTSTTSTTDTTTPTATSTATSTPPATTSTTPASEATHVLISEILFDADGSDTGKEFVEIYNPTDSAISLAGYSLKYTQENSTTSHSLASISKSASSTDISVAPAKGFLLFGFGHYDSANYGGKTADVSRSASLPNGSSDGSAQKIKISLLNDDDATVDELTYDKNSISSAGYGLERLAWNSACVSAQSSNEFLGNGCANGDVQFETRKTPNPQNSLSMTEPRIAPTAPIAPEEQNLAVYSANTLEVNFAWQESKDAENSTVGMIYKIFDLSGSTPLFMSSTTATSTKITIGEVGREYAFGVKADDRDGLSSATSSALVNALGFVDNIYFYKNPASSSTPKYIADVRYSTRPFIPQLLSGGFRWQGLMFYKNRIPNNENNRLASANSYAPVNSAGVMPVSASRSPALFGLTPADSQGFGPGLFGTSFLLPEEDGRLALEMQIASATSTDYLTVAYYDAINTGGYAAPAGEYDFGLIATDARKIPYQEIFAPQSAPTMPENFTTSFDELGMKLNLSWVSSTDADSVDSEITYETNYSTSTEFSTSAWVSAGKTLSAQIPVIFGNAYMLGVRAVDDFGNPSPVNSTNWNFPDGFAPVEPFIGNFAGRRCAGGAQPILTPPQNMKISSVEFSAMCVEGACGPSNDFTIYDDAGTLLAHSEGGTSYFGYPNYTRLTQYFANENQIVLSAGTTYSVIPRSEHGNCIVEGEFKITGRNP